jgi:hypothetical protein
MICQIDMGWLNIDMDIDIGIKMTVDMHTTIHMAINIPYILRRIYEYCY